MARIARAIPVVVAMAEVIGFHPAHLLQIVAQRMGNWDAQPTPLAAAHTSFEAFHTATSALRRPTPVSSASASSCACDETLIAVLRRVHRQ